MKQLRVNPGNDITAIPTNQLAKRQNPFAIMTECLSRLIHKRPLTSEKFKSEESGTETARKNKTSFGPRFSYAAITIGLAFVLVAPFILGSCSGTTIQVVAPPETPIIKWVDLGDINNGYYNMGVLITAGEPFAIPLDTRTVPALGGSTIEIRNSDNKIKKIIQTNDMVITGIVTSQGDTLEGTISGTYTMSFKMAIDEDVTNGDKFFGGETQLRFLNERTIYIASRSWERDNGEIWGAVGNPIHGDVGGSAVFARAIGYPPVDVYTKTVASKYYKETLLRNDYWTVIVDYGTQMDGIVHSVSPMDWMVKDFDTAVNFPVGSAEYKAGLYNMDDQIHKIWNGAVNCDVFINRYKIYPPDVDNSLFTQYIGGNVDVSKDMGSNNRVLKLTFTTHGIPVREDMPANLFSSTDKVQVWARHVPDPSKPNAFQFVISSR